MKRYFFDIVGRQRSEYDYRGHNFPSLTDAHKMAELIALDLGIESEGAWSGWCVEVRNVHGQQLLAIPVQPICLAA